MTFLFPDIPKQQEIRLQAGDEPLKAFYKLVTAERTMLDGITVRSEWSRVIHVTLRTTGANSLALNLETFDAKRRDSVMSLSIKDLLARVERCYQDLDLTLDDKGQIRSVQNLEQIRELLSEQKAYLAERFNGPGMQAIDQFGERVLQSEATLVRYICNDRKLGLLFNIPYGAVGASWMPMMTTRTNNFMEQTTATVSESFRLGATDATQIRIEGRGQLAHNLQTGLFYAGMRRNKLPFDPRRDKPVLSRYTRDIILEPGTYRVQAASLSARFELGKSYAKEIDYELSVVTADEV